MRDERLNLGVEAANLPRDRRGMGRYVRSVLREFATALAHRVRVTLLVPDLLPALAAPRYLQGLPDGIAVARRAASGRLGLDLVWYPWNGMTWVAPGIKVATVHDCWPFESPAASTAVRKNEQRPFLTTAANADLIIANSAFGRGEIVRHLGFPVERIVVVPLGVDPLADEPSGAVDSTAPYVLFVGHADSRKGLGILLGAMAALPEARRATLRLVVVGKGQFASAGPAPPGTNVDFAGEVDDARLAQLYAGASAFIFPSTYEGFGLPVLEAMAYGVPVVASDAASVPEAAGDAALYYPSGDAAALAAAMQLVLDDAALADKLRAAGRIRAETLTWERCAEATLTVLERAAKRRQRVS